MTIADNLARVKDAVADACKRAGRPSDSVRLVAASKSQPASAVLEAAKAGQKIFGENYAREMREKRLELAGSFLNLEWHFIGRVQGSNAKDIADATLVHGVGSTDQYEKLGKRREGAPALLQLSLWGEGSKNGFTEADLDMFLTPMLQHSPGKGAQLDIRGFMAMPPPGVDARKAFEQVRLLRDKKAPQLKELSMGMSADFADAILEGATLVRIGTAIFGERPRKEPA